MTTEQEIVRRAQQTLLDGWIEDYFEYMDITDEGRYYYMVHLPTGKRGRRMPTIGLKPLSDEQREAMIYSIREYEWTTIV